MKKKCSFLSLLAISLILFINSPSFAGSVGTSYGMSWDYSPYGSSDNYYWNQPYSYGWNQPSYSWNQPYSYDWNQPSYSWNQPYSYDWNQPSYSWNQPYSYDWNQPSYSWNQPYSYDWNQPSYGWNDESNRYIFGYRPNSLSTVTGRVVGPNSIEDKGRVIRCWISSEYAGTGNQPLAISEYMGLVIEVSGQLHTNDLYSAKFKRIVY